MGQRICVFGDSIAWGAEDDECGGWADRLKVFIKKTGKFNEVFNLANPGKDSNYLVEFMENDCLARLSPDKRKVNVIIVQIGMNDSQYIQSQTKQRIDKEITRKNTEKIIEISKKFVDRVVFVGLTPVDEKRSCPLMWNGDKYHKQESVQEYNDVIKDVCQKKEIYFIDVMELLNSEDLSDGIHPNERGHRKLFNKICNFLGEKKLIRHDK